MWILLQIPNVFIYDLDELSTNINFYGRLGNVKEAIDELNNVKFHNS